MKKIVFLLLILSFLSVYSAVSVTGSQPDWNVYFSFDNLANSTGRIVDYRNPVYGTMGYFKNSSDVTENPSYTSTSTASGDPFDGKAVYLNGSHFVKMGNYRALMSLGSTGGHKITISMWVKFYYSSPYGNDCLIGKNSDEGGNNFLFGIWSQKMYVRIGSGTYDYRNNTYVDGTNGSPIDVYDGDWHHFVVAVEEDSANPGTSDVTIWIDGSKIWDKRSVNNTISDSEVLDGKWPTVGMELDGTTKSDFLEGYVDELQFFGDVATDDDVDNLYNGRFGTINKIDTWVSSIEDYYPAGYDPDHTDDLWGPHDNADGFLYNAYNVWESNRYEYLNDNSDFSSVAKDQDVLINDCVGNPPQIVDGWMKDDDQDDHEVVFHAGHGHIFGPIDWNNNDNISLLPTYYDYSGDTRWVFYQSCNTMKYVAHGKKPCSLNDQPCCPNANVGDVCFGASIEPSPSTEFYDNEGLEWFGDRFNSSNGPHAIFGFASIMRFFSKQTLSDGCSFSVNGYTTNNSDYCNSSDDANRVLFNQDFWEDVVVENEPLWDAYKNAVEDRIWQSHIEKYAVEATVAYKKDDSIGFDGSLERLGSVYRRGSSSLMNLEMKTIVYEGCHTWEGGYCQGVDFAEYREDDE